MTTIDLSSPAPPPASLLDALPRRVALTLPELTLVAERAGGAPLPFDVAAPGAASPPGSPVDSGGDAVEDRAYAAALDSLHDPAVSLARRGLLTDTDLDEGLAGAVGLLATPTYAVEIDVVAGDARVKAWHRADRGAVATLATADGIVFELAWFPTSAWPGELARAGVLPEDLELGDSRVPAFLDLPYELVDAAVEAAAEDRGDVVPVLAGQHADGLLDELGRAVPAAQVPSLLAALATEAQGRLRVLVADVSQAETTVVGVRSWVLLADGWRTVRPHRDRHGAARVELRAVRPEDLAADLAPVLSEVSS